MLLDDIESSAGKPFDIREVRGLRFIAEGDGYPRLTGASRASNSMDIRLGNIWKVVVENMADAINVDAS